jgi:NADH-quinone oxidoreductase subunit N
VDLFLPQVKKTWLSYIAGAGLAATAGISCAWIDKEIDFAGIIAIDNYTTYFRVLFMGIAAVISLASGRLVAEHMRHPGEYYGLIIISTIGAVGMAASRELMTAYLSLELLSFSLYALVSFAKMDGKSNEAGIKYIVLGAFASAMFLYGISLIYGITGSTYYSEISSVLSEGTESGRC